MNSVNRGDVVALRPERGARGREQKGRRYGVVVQASHLSGLSTVIVAPTSTNAIRATFRPQVEVRGRRTLVLADQLRALDRGRLGRRQGRLTQSEIERVDEALALLLSLQAP